MLKAGDVVPDLTLESDTGERLALAEAGAGKVVLFFYPKDDTPGCTIECKEFRDALPAFQGKARVFGISPDDAQSHQAFREKFGLTFPLLSDPGHRAADAFGVWGQTRFGEGILRTTFILSEGRVERVFEEVKPQGHASEVLAAVS